MIQVAYSKSQQDQQKSNQFGLHRTTCSRANKTVASTVLLLQNISLSAIVPRPVPDEQSFCSSKMCFDETEEQFVLKMDDRLTSAAQSSRYHRDPASSQIWCPRPSNVFKFVETVLKCQFCFGSVILFYKVIERV